MIRLILFIIVFLSNQAITLGYSDKIYTEVSCQNLTNKDTEYHIFFADTSKWHPEEFHIIYPDMKLSFKLPYENDRSGVANLLFIDKENGTVHQLDYIDHKTKQRRYTHLAPSIYDVILLYNNGKYLRRSDVFFERNTSLEIDMKILSIHPSDSESKHWLTMRAFNTPIGDRELLRKNYTTDSKLKCRGYVFSECGNAMNFPAIRIVDSINKQTIGALDGYVEFEFNTNQKIAIAYVGSYSCEITLTANSGIFIILEDSKFDGNESLIHSAPLIKFQ